MPEPILRIGVIADTHIPDRARSLHPGLLPALQNAGIDRILHAGDVSTWEVIHELETIAPVSLARGNRDWAFMRTHPWVHRIEAGGITIALMHGHINWFHYLTDKWFYMRDGYRLERYLGRLLTAARDAQVVVFGHTHHTEMIWVDGRLIFNPGSATFGYRRHLKPSWGLLSIWPGGKVTGEIYELDQYRFVDGNWHPIS